MPLAGVKRDDGYVVYKGAGTTINLAANSTLDVQGDTNSINSASPGAFTVSSGRGNIFNLGSAGVGVGYSAMTLTLQHSDSISTINAGANTQFTYTGDGSTLNLGLNDVVWVNGSNNTFNETGGSITVQTGANNIFNLGGTAGDGTSTTLSFWGIGPAGATINGGGNISVTAIGATINARAGETVRLGGSSNTLNMTTNGVASIDFSGADGADTVTTYGLSGPSGRLSISGWSGNSDPNHVWLDRSGGDLKITMMGRAETVTITNWFGGGAAQLATFQVGSHTLANTDVASLLSAMSTYEANYASSHGGAAFDPSAVANDTITDATLVGVVNSVWHPV